MDGAIDQWNTTRAYPDVVILQNSFSISSNGLNANGIDLSVLAMQHPSHNPCGLRTNSNIELIQMPGMRQPSDIVTVPRKLVAILSVFHAYPSACVAAQEIDEHHFITTMSTTKKTKRNGGECTEMWKYRVNGRMFNAQTDTGVVNGACYSQTSIVKRHGGFFGIRRQNLRNMQLNCLGMK